jgi:ribosome-binding factor A
VTSVRVSADLREATVFYTVFGDEAEATSSAAALDSSRGLVRSEIGKRTGIKFTPTVEFIRDALPENVRVIDDLLQVAAIADKAVHEQAAQARYAGDSDPYRKSDSGSE